VNDPRIDEQDQVRSAGCDGTDALAQSVVRGVVTVDVADLEELQGIPAGVAVCVDLGELRWVDFRVLDVMAAKTWGVWAVTVRGTDPVAVCDTVGYLQRRHHEYAVLEVQDAAAAAAAEDRWWNGGLDEAGVAGG
jgi:hypothetical protein